MSHFRPLENYIRRNDVRLEILRIDSTHDFEPCHHWKAAEGPSVVVIRHHDLVGVAL